MLGYFKNRKLLKAQASELYGRVVAQSRLPAFYSEFGVPDSPEGRLETIVIHLVLVIRRLRREGEAGDRLARTVAEAFVTDMDDCMREMGISDLTVPKKVKKAAGALWDRARDYGPALDAADKSALAELLAQHVTQGNTTAAKALAAYMLTATDTLGAQTDDPLTGAVRFPSPAAE